MSKLKWFASGVARGNQAVIIITELLTDFANDPNKAPLQKVLLDYKDELEKKESSVPYILSRMNIAVSNIMVKNGITLSQEQSDKFRKLTSLSNIRYGY